MTREARRDDLIAAALELFSTRAPEDVSVEDVTTRADVSRALFYRYFPSVRELQVAALRSVVDGLLARLAARAEGTPHERLRAAVRALAEVAAEHRAGYVALVRSGSAIATPETNAIVDEVREAAVRVILADAGITDPSPMLLTTLRCWTVVVEGALLTWLREGGLEQGKLDGWLVDQLVAMIGATERHDPDTAVSSALHPARRRP
ncbi:TetR family transcriptional regulator [Prauserella sp. PE36]|uniref:TetR/AcrR family transcriptional regulator n=1 Tax=Prauserella endophytica TaxID=1592324 RepID=A0ABY2S1G6_9PSEU|nr:MULTISPECIES: TetR/AcrR family transcriptional regulator [Prauserella]PXY37210.1 TetR family transcriptional regulator [Prauserella coralliicola]RBM10370.1 TetR family transcriptional regulator [Prauserella sp. PE36]TKG68507.1 TetR/AcrR family transcriptional regulator [Prauserella endophytica]